MPDSNRGKVSVAATFGGMMKILIIGSGYWNTAWKPLFQRPNALVVACTCDPDAGLGNDPLFMFPRVRPDIVVIRVQFGVPGELAGIRRLVSVLRLLSIAHCDNRIRIVLTSTHASVCDLAEDLAVEFSPELPAELYSRVMGVASCKYRVATAGGQ